MKRLIIYDLDGTLVDTREDIACAVNHMLNIMNKPPMEQGAVARLVGRGLHQLVKSSLKTGDLKQIEKGAKIYREFYAKHMLDHSTLYPDARNILEYFKDRKQAVITNKPNPFSTEILTALGIAGYFVQIIAGDTEYPKKPDPAAVLSMMKREKVSADETLFVGDSLIDIETGRNAGIETVVISHGFEAEEELKSANSTALLRNFEELLTFARQKGW